MKRDYYSPYLQVEPEGEDENWLGFLVTMERLRDSHRFPRTRYSPFELGAGYDPVEGVVFVLRNWCIVPIGKSVDKDEQTE